MRSGVLFTVFIALSLGFMLITFFFVESLKLKDDVGEEAEGLKIVVFSKENSNNTAFGRKLLQSADGGGMNRIGTTCSKEDIIIYQGQTAPLPNGIPTYAVQILNTCTSGCSISNIHVSCGWFSSDRLVNPRVFRRIYYDDCLVNDGLPLGPGQTLFFQYASTYPYPLSVSSVSCC